MSLCLIQCRKSNELLPNESNYECNIEAIWIAGPTEDDYQQQGEQAKNLVKIGNSGRWTYEKK